MFEHLVPPKEMGIMGYPILPIGYPIGYSIGYPIGYPIGYDSRYLIEYPAGCTHYLQRISYKDISFRIYYRISYRISY